MRQKELRLVVTFHTTAGAMAMEKLCKSQKIPGRLIPVPREISAGCGIAWRSEPAFRQTLEALASQAGIETGGFYEVII